MNPRRLYRSRDRQLAGVAGGMAEYLDVDPTIIRVAWILVTIFTGGLALLGYLLLALIIPNSPYSLGATPAGPAWGSQPGAAWGAQPGPAWGGQPAPGGSWASGTAPTAGGWTVPPASTQWQPQGAPVVYAPARQTRGLGAAGIVGIVLVVIGAIALLDVVLPGVRFGVALGPAVILALGAALLVSSVRRPVEPHGSSPASTSGTASGASADPAWSGVPADLTPWPATAAPSRPAEAPAAQPDEAAPTAQPAYESDETRVDPI